MYNNVFEIIFRIDICDDDDDCGLLGASIVGSICDPLDQVVLCEDNGLRLGFNIAHQIGHTSVFTYNVIFFFNQCLLDQTPDYVAETNLKQHFVILLFFNFVLISKIPFLFQITKSGINLCIIKMKPISTFYAIEINNAHLFFSIDNTLVRNNICRHCSKPFIGCKRFNCYL